MADRAKALGYQLTGEQLQAVFDDFKKLADKKKDIYDGDIIALIEQRIHGGEQTEWSLVGFEVASGSGRKPQAIESITTASLMERVGPRLAQRAEQAGMQCDLQIEPESANRSFTTDLNVVEQILFNLVDNAAKYARVASDQRIHVIAEVSGGSICFTVRDHGPGFDSRRTGQRLRAFGKSAQESAESAPGVGLGLALCRRLARQLGGQLEIASAPGGGAMATLLLPAK